MKIVRYASGAAAAVGVLEGERVFRVHAASLAQALEASLAGRLDVDRSGSLPLAQVELLAPVEPHNKILAVALNYEGHIKEAAQSRPERPIVFQKPFEALIGPGAAIPKPAVTGRLDYEGELALVIGRECYRVTPEDAFSCIAGITAFNDMSARDLLRVKAGNNEMLDWFSSKCLDSITPVGPAIVTLDEVEPQLRAKELSVVTRVNGREVQRAKIADMIFGIPALVAFISSRVRLLPGDIIATGTPPGVGASTGTFLKAGDTVEVDIAPIPVLRNRIA